MRLSFLNGAGEIFECGLTWAFFEFKIIFHVSFPKGETATFGRGELGHERPSADSDS
jgi:hypothetical protein